MTIKKAWYSFVIFFLLALVSKSYCQQWDPWVSDSITTNGSSYGFIHTLKSEGDSLLVGGTFTHIGQETINSMAIWDGNTWKSIGNGISESAEITTFSRYHGQLFAGGGIGNFSSTIRNLCKFNNPGWAPVDTAQPGSYVTTLIEYNNLLFIGGGFSDIGTDYSEYLANIATYNGSTFEYVGWPGRPRYFSIYNGELYASCRDFGLKKWNGGTSWSMSFGGVWGNIECALVDTFNNFFYVGGSFFYVGGDYWGGNNLESWEVAMWDGFNWNLFGKELYGDVIALDLYRGEIYAGGVFDINQVTGDTLNYIARWDGQHWRPLGGGSNNTINTMEAFNDSLFVGGYMDTVDNQKCWGLAKWYMPPDTDCTYLQPRAFVLDDTLNLWEGHAGAQFYNNNAYADNWYWDFGDGYNSTEKDPLHDYTNTGVYNVTVTVSHNGCTKTAINTVVVDIFSGSEINKDWDYGFKLYPNPTSGDITVECTIPPNVKGEIRSFNAYGSLQKTFSLQSGKNKVLVNTKEIPSGISLCGLYVGGKQVLIEKVVKNE